MLPHRCVCHAVLAFLPALGIQMGASRARAGSDADVYALIDTWKPIAEAIVIDGNGSDWGSIPTFPDPIGDSAGAPDEDITGVAIAPLDDALLVRIDTAAPPPTSGRVFWLMLDFRGQQFFDVKLSFHLDWLDDLDAFPETEPVPARVQSEIATVAVGSVFEARIPYALVDPLLPVSMQGQLSGPGARPWVRAKAFTGEPFFTESDHGSAVASFRLVDTPYTLDPAPPPGSESGVPTRLPLRGLWYLGQGSHGFGSHETIPWAYDLHRTDNALLPESPPGSVSNSDNFSFGRGLLAPRDGFVNWLVDDQVDLPAYTVGFTPANFLFLEIPGGVGLLFSHTKMGSIPLAPLDPVSEGDDIGAVGNSGSSDSWAHLHYEAREVADPNTSLPITLTDVEVGLNPSAADPWRRSFTSWIPREGFFVRRAVSAVPVLGPAGLAVLTALLALAGGLMGAARHPARGKRGPRPRGS